MGNREFLKHMEYLERVYRELHGVEAARKYTEALDHARKLVEENETHCVDDGDWGRATGAGILDEDPRDGWHVGSYSGK